MIEAMICGSVLIVMILLVRSLGMGKISKRFQYALWGIVLVRLLLPFSLMESSISVMNLMMWEGWKVSDQRQDMLEDDREISGNFVSGLVTDMGKINDEIITERQEEGNKGIKEAPMEMNPETTVWKVVNPWKMAWILGSIVTGLWFVLRNVKVYGKLKQERILLDDAKWACPLPLYQMESMASPCLFGIVRPAVYLTKNSLEDEEICSYAIAHEMAHYRHFDHIWALLMGVILVMYWWNPLVWTGIFYARIDCELACDEAVISAFGGRSRIAYGHALVSLLKEGGKTTELLNLATTMSGGKKESVKRLELIVKEQKNSRGILAVTIFAVFLTAACTFTGKDNSNAKESVESITIYEDGDAGEFVKIDSKIVGKEEITENPTASVAESVTQSEAGYHLEEAVHEEILRENNAMVESHFTLATLDGERYSEEAGTALKTVEVYAIVLAENYAKNSDGGFYCTSGSNVPSVLTFDIMPDGRYVLTNYWIPRDGSYYKPDIEKRFGMLPDEIIKEAMDTQKYVWGSIQNNYRQIVEQWDINTVPIIEGLLKEIMSSPMESSNPNDYINAHYIEYRELIYLNEYTMEYMKRLEAQSMLQGMDSGLKWEILKRVEEDLIQKADLLR